MRRLCPAGVGSEGATELRNRSTTRMVPLQSGHLGSVTDGLGSSPVSSALA